MGKYPTPSSLRGNLTACEVPYGVKWLEECLQPEGYAEVRAKVGHLVMFTTGEHEYTRYGYRILLEKKCADVLQPDITWYVPLIPAQNNRNDILSGSVA